MSGLFNLMISDIEIFPCGSKQANLDWGTVACRMNILEERILELEGQCSSKSRIPGEAITADQPQESDAPLSAHSPRLAMDSDSAILRMEN